VIRRVCWLVHLFVGVCISPPAALDGRSAVCGQRCGRSALHVPGRGGCLRSLFLVVNEVALGCH